MNAAKPTGGQSKPIGTYGLRSVDDGLKKRTYIADDVMHVSDGVLFKKAFPATTYQTLFRVFTQNTIALKLTIIAQGAAGTLQKTFHIVSNGSGGNIVTESSCSIGTMSDVTIDINASGNIFAACAETSTMSLFIECYDTYLHGHTGNFIQVY